MDTKIPLQNQYYKIYQTANKSSKGIAIIVNTDILSKEEKWNEHDGWIKLISLNNKGEKLFVIGVYMINDNREKVIRELEEVTNRIRRMYANEQIIVAGDFNMKPSQVNIMESKIKLKCNHENKTLWTREQKYKSTMKYSTLDYIFSSLEIQNLTSWSTQGVSDHYIIKWNLLTRIPRVKLTYTIIRTKRNPNNDELEQFKKSKWPLEQNKTLELATYKTIIRPKIFVDKQIRNISGEDVLWKVKQRAISKIINDRYIENLKYMNDLKKINIKKFFIELENIIQLRNKNKIVRQIKENNKVLPYNESLYKLTNYYKKIYAKGGMPEDIEFKQAIFSYEVDTTRGIREVAKNKAVGKDQIPAEWIQKAAEDIKYTVKLNNIFKYWLTTCNVPNFWMSGRLILLNKESNKYPQIENARPITILPAITKIFELSIMNNTEKWIYTDKLLNRNQRGSIKRMNADINIQEVIEFGFKTRLKNKEIGNKGYLIFIDLHKAYDNVDRNILFKLLEEKRIPNNVIKLLQNMYSKFRVTIDGINWIDTKNGLPQGSSLSPLLFNIYIDGLLEALEGNNLLVKAFADDVVIGVESENDINIAWIIVKEWWLINKLEVNSKKSCLLRIAYRKCKVKEIYNVLGIKEVEQYEYFEIMFDQGLKFNRIPKSLKTKEIAILSKLRRLNFQEVDIQTRKVAFQSLCMQRLTYGIAWIYNKSKSYKKYIKGWIYRVLKRCFSIRGNPSTDRLLSLFGVNLDLMVWRKIDNTLWAIQGISKTFSFKSKLIVNNSWSIETINFLMMQMPIKFGYKETWKWGESLNFKHAFNSWKLMIKWREKAMKALGADEVSSLDVTMRRCFISIKSSEINKLNEIATDFNNLCLTLRSKHRIN